MFDETRKRAIERALRSLAPVVDCALVERRGRDGQRQWVAYVITSAACSPADLAAQLATVPGGDAVVCVQVSSLPLAPSGHIDVAKLASIPIVDSDLVRRAEEAARALGAERASAIVQDRNEPRKPLHLWTLIPSEARRAADTKPAVSSVASGRAASGTGTEIPAIAHGAPLAPTEADLPATLAASLQRAARMFPDHGIVYVEPNGADVVQPYPALLEEAHRALAGLRRLGLAPGDPVLLQLPSHREFFEVFWGCVLGGFVPVPISPAPQYVSDNSAAAKLLTAWQIFNRPAVVAGAQTVADIKGFLERSGEGLARVVAADRLKTTGRDDAAHPSRPDEVALMMLTSGSTGKPKGVMLTHANLLARSVGSRQMNGFSERDVSLNWMPLDHVAGIIYFHLRDVFLGSRQVHAPTELILQDPLLWLDLIDRHRATVTFAPNFAFGLVNDRAGEIVTRKWDLSSMRFVLNGGEAIVARTARRFLSLLTPHGLAPTALHPAWGMSETSSGTTYSDRFSLATTSDDDPFVEVGAPIPGLSIRIVDPTGAVVEEGAVGRLQVKGTMVTRGYYERPDLNASVFTPDGWFDTGDLATIRQGQLAIAGREKDDIVINGVKYYSHEIEAAVEEVAGVATSFTAACAVRGRGTDTEQLAVFFVPESADAVPELVKEIRHAVVARAGISPHVVVPVTRSDIPKTAIGKIQRSDVRRRFEAGDFDRQVMALDIESENANTVPDWFFRATWRRKELSAADAPRLAPVVMFDDGVSVGAAIARTLAGSGATCIRVEPGVSFEKSTPTSYRVRPRDEDDYARLLASLAADGYESSDYVHLWACTPIDGDGRPKSAERDRSAISVLLLAQALAASRSEGPKRLLVVSSHAQAVGADDRVQPERTGLAGIAKSIAQELPALRARHVDIDAGPLDATAATLLAELGVDDGESEVAYRAGVRMVAILERIRFGDGVREAPPIVPGGFYVVAGGLGGVGLEISKWLVTRFAARLLVLGRTPIGNGNHEAAHGEGERVRAHETLCAAARVAGTSIEYASVDITDAARLRSVVEDAQTRVGRSIDGVFHIAGLFKDRLIVEESAATFEDVLAAKLDGSVALADLLEDASGKLFVSFSSVAGFLGRFGGAAYAASSCVQEAVARAQRRRGITALAIAWSTWDDLGVNRGFSAAQGRARGYYAIPKAKGLSSLLVALNAGEALVLVGLDTQSPALRSRVVDESMPIHSVRVFATAAAPLPRTVTIDDRFGRPVVIDIERTTEMPVLASGEIDRAALAGSASRRTEGRRTPETELERLIARTWQDVLNVSEVDTAATFFDAGGTSLLLAQVYSRLRAATPTPLSMTEMFRYPTISALASYLEGRGDAAEVAALSDDGDRGRDRRAMAQRARRRTAPALS